MLSQSQKKHIKSLRLKKFRNLHGGYVVEGDKICKEILLSNVLGIKSIYCTSDWYKTNEAILKDNTDITFNATITELGQISSLKSPPAVIMEMKMPKTDYLADLDFDQPAFYLNRIQDPGNLGTIIRISDWFGLPQLFLSPGCVDPYNPKVVQAAMTSHLRVGMIQIELGDLKTQYQQLKIYAADMGGHPINELKISDQKALIVIGNEGQGVDQSLSHLFDDTISISGKHKLGAESLNAAMTAGIIAYELRR